MEYTYATPGISRREAVTARGGRRLGRVIAEAARNGAKVDGWDEYFNYQIWMDAFKTCGVDPDYYTIRGFGEDELLPWDPINVGVSKKFLLRERKRAYEGIITPDCRHGCSGCGANGLLQEVECDA